MKTGMFLRHLIIRLRVTVTDAGAMTILAAAAAVSLILWPWMLRPVGVQPRVLTGMILVILVMVWPMMLGSPAAGRAVGAGARRGLPSRGLPALPIGARWRVLAESISTMGIVLVVRTLLMAPLLAFLDPENPLVEITGIREAPVADSLFGAAMTLPVLLVWSPPSTPGRFPAARPLVVAVLVVILSTVLSPVPAVIACVALGAVILARVDVEPRPGRFHVAFREWRGPLHRLARHPESQLRHDLLAGPIRRRWPLILAVFLFAMGAVAVDRLVELPEIASSVVHGVGLGSMLSLMPMLVITPMGLDLLRTDMLTSEGLMGGGFSAAWSVLPVRPETVLRALYVHGILVGLSLWLFLTGYAGVCVALGINSSRIFNLIVPLGMAIPSASGLLVSTAVGDRPRGYVSLACLLLFLPVHLTCLIEVGRLVGSRDALLIDLGAMLILALAGGVPALVHLRGRTPIPLKGG